MGLANDTGKCGASLKGFDFPSALVANCVGNAENARTTVATARALKNASELMKDDENIKFFQLLETITKIADKGKHTFMIGDIQQMTKQ